MPRRYYRHRRRFRDSDTYGAVVIVVILGVLIAYERLPRQALELVAAGVILLVALIIFLIIYLYFRRATRERQRLQALSTIDIDVMSGWDFEKYVAALLKAQGYTNISLTERFDHGVDIIATKDGIRWGVQVKRHRSIIKDDAVRQVIAGLNHYKCKQGMVVTNSVFTTRAKITAKENNCILVDKDMLAEWMVTFRA
jgi:HJR/Mrr/RecB family endonuclease